MFASEVMLKFIIQATRSLWQPVARQCGFQGSKCGCVAVLTDTSHRSASSYKPYPEFDTPSPYRKKEPFNYGYRKKVYDGGILPRPKGKMENIPLPMPKLNPALRDNWTQKKALFGQNDYIDLLGDGSIHPWQTIVAPQWLKGFKGNELQRLGKKQSFQGAYMKEYQPQKYLNMRKQIFYLYKRLNRRQRSNYWGSKRMSQISRIDRIRDF